jgi:NAD(P)-dependent dehydrogenase (short-subunit alcohol dehydrogenase family)
MSSSLFMLNLSLSTLSLSMYIYIYIDCPSISNINKQKKRSVDLMSVAARPKSQRILTSIVYNMASLCTLFQAIACLYIGLPMASLLLFREPEISPTLYQHADVTVFGLMATILATWRLGWARGFIPCLAACIGTLVYSMDVLLLWQPPPSDTNLLAGKVAVLTGANTGIGKATSLALVRMGAHVVMTCRSLERCQEAVDEANAVGRENTGGSARAAVLDLHSLESVYNLTTQLCAEYPTIHYLFNNAGSTPNNALTQDGLEDGFGGMHLAHMALTLGILPSLRNAGEDEKSTPARIIMISSSAALLAATGMLGLGSAQEPFQSSFMSGNGEGDLRGEVIRGNGMLIPSLTAYSRAKLCNCFFAFEINRHFQHHHWPIIAHCVHPGGVYTESSVSGLASIFHAVPGIPYLVSKILVPLLWRTPEAGSRTLLFAALSNEPSPFMLNGGQYIDPLCHPALNDNHPKYQALRDADTKWSSRLWNVSLRLLLESPARNVVQMAP